MRDYFIAVNPTLWDVVDVGITFPSGNATLTQDQALYIQRNYQALHLIKSSLCAEEFDKVDGLQSTKEAWNTLFINHKGTKRVREGRIRALESELNRFICKENETPQEMIEDHLITIKESKLSKEMSKIHEEIKKKNGVALKASHKNKEKEASTSSKATIKKDDDDSDSESMDEEEIALFMRRIRKVMKRGGFFYKNKNKDKNKRMSKRPCFGCGKEGHFLANCLEVKIKRNDSSKFDKRKHKKKVGEAHLGQE
ncbi:hypothetical protein SETIT_4G116900v2 [Setaria italica]|uniref:CCHC-type domain-containing protein n=1 Tax=Setaria italica TaxID=4555 RepID=A0A368QT77_SETIT|nr:hypothetical protein SETIT_4G116900v2 [Setaria italica]